MGKDPKPPEDEAQSRRLALCELARSSMLSAIQVGDPADVKRLGEREDN